MSEIILSCENISGLQRSALIDFCNLYKFDIKDSE